MANQAILECDIGNTRCKWRVVVGSEVVGRGSFNYQQGFDDLAGLQGLARIRVACVAPAETLQQLALSLQGHKLELEIANTGAALGVIRNAYAEHGRLGIDRWLAIIAAYKRQRGAALIIDAGSALTVDLLDRHGQHLGGYILPGSELMKTSLLADTGGVRFEQGDYSAGVAFGCSTVDAVHAGILSAQLGAVLIAIAEAEKTIQQEFAILVTGGDADLIVNNLPQEFATKAEIVPELVLDGLQWVLP